MLILCNLLSLAPPSLFLLIFSIDFSPSVRGHQSCLWKKVLKDSTFFADPFTFHFLLQGKNHTPYPYLPSNFVVVVLYLKFPKVKKINCLPLPMKKMQAKVMKISYNSTVKGRWIYKRKKEKKTHRFVRILKCQNTGLHFIYVQWSLKDRDQLTTHSNRLFSKNDVYGAIQINVQIQITQFLAWGFWSLNCHTLNTLKHSSNLGMGRIWNCIFKGFVLFAVVEEERIAAAKCGVMLNTATSTLLQRSIQDSPTVF